jgi:hypothetical protein
MRGKKPLEPMQIYIVQDNHCSVACTTDQTLAYALKEAYDEWCSGWVSCATRTLTGRSWVKKITLDDGAAQEYLRHLRELNRNAREGAK